MLLILYILEKHSNILNICFLVQNIKVSELFDEKRIFLDLLKQKILCKHTVSFRSQNFLESKMIPLSKHACFPNIKYSRQKT